MLKIIFLLLAGYVIGFGIAGLLFYKKAPKSSGCLIVDFDSDDENLFSLELYEGLMDVYAKKEIILDVVHSRE